MAIALTQLGIITYIFKQHEIPVPMFPQTSCYRYFFSVYTYGHVYFPGDGCTLIVLIFPCYYFQTA